MPANSEWANDKTTKTVCYLGSILTSDDRCNTKIKEVSERQGSFERSSKYFDKQNGQVGYMKKNIKLLSIVNSFIRL